MRIYLTKQEVATVLGVCERTVENYSLKHEIQRLKTGDQLLPSSPANGLYSIWFGLGADGGQIRRGWWQGDLLDYIQNSVFEALGLSLLNRRAKGRA